MIGLADSGGAEVADFRYDAFGVERGATGSAAALPSDLGCDFRYHGQWQERASGLYYVRARNYDPGSGRFLSRDAVEGAFAQPETFHPYTWNANNPEVFRDPTGRFSLVSISVANGITNNLSSISRTALVNFFRERAKDEVLGVAGDIFLDAVGKLVPSIAGGLNFGVELLKNSRDNGAAGKMFEGVLVKTICDFVGVGPVRDALRLEVGVKDNGEPADNGIQCPPSPVFGNATARPDFIFSQDRPRDLESSGPKSHAIGDIKIGISSLFSKSRPSNPSRQWKAIVNHARDYSHSRAAMFVTWYEPTPRQLKTLLGRATRQKVVLVLVSLSDRRQR